MSKTERAPVFMLLALITGLYGLGIFIVGWYSAQTGIPLREGLRGVTGTLVGTSGVVALLVSGYLYHCYWIELEERGG